MKSFVFGMVLMVLFSGLALAEPKTVQCPLVHIQNIYQDEWGRGVVIVKVNGGINLKARTPVMVIAIGRLETWREDIYNIARIGEEIYEIPVKRTPCPDEGCELHICVKLNGRGNPIYVLSLEVDWSSTKPSGYNPPWRLIE